MDSFRPIERTRSRLDFGEDDDTLASEPVSEPPALPKFEVTKGQFHVFTWLASSEGSGDFSMAGDRLGTALQEVQKLLLKESHPKDRKAYKAAFMEAKRNDASFESVRRTLEKLPTDTKPAQDWQKYITVFLRDAVEMYQFFLPLDCQAPPVACFWAALQRIADVSSTQRF